jgi:hypothetical protein
MDFDAAKRVEVKGEQEQKPVAQGIVARAVGEKRFFWRAVKNPQPIPRNHPETAHLAFLS